MRIVTKGAVRRLVALVAVLVACVGVPVVVAALATDTPGTSGGGLEQTLLEALRVLPWWGVAAVVAFSPVGKGLGSWLTARAGMLAQAQGGGTGQQTQLQQAVVDVIKEVSTTVKEVTETQQTLAEGLGDLTEIVRDMQKQQLQANMMQQQVSQQQQEMLRQQQQTMEKLAELMGRLQAIPAVR